MEDKDKKKIALTFGDSPEEGSVEHGVTSLEKALSQLVIPGTDLAKGEGPLSQAIRSISGNAAKKKAPSLAFSELPSPQSNFLGLFKARTRLLPPELIKTIRVTDHLVAAILRTRGNIMKLYGHLRKDRFDIGLELEIKPEFKNLFTPEQFAKVAKRMKRLESIILNCGHTEGLEQQDQMTIADFMSIQTIRNYL
jgi:hypothetical protein